MRKIAKHERTLKAIRTSRQFSWRLVIIDFFEGHYPLPLLCTPVPFRNIEKKKKEGNEEGK